MEIGEKIKFLRRMKGLNQTQLAEQSKVSLPYINNIENGKANAVSDTIYEQIATALGVSLNDIKDSQKGFKVGFQPSVWSIPLISLLLNNPSIEARMSYTYNTETQDKDFYSLNDKDEVRRLSDINGYEFKGGNNRKNNEIAIIEDKIEKLPNVEFISEKGLIEGLSNQEYDIIFAPVTYDTDSGLSSIASICSTVQGGIYAVVFSKDPKKMGLEDGVKFNKNEILKKFLAIYKDKEQWDELIKNSYFFYQQSSISEYIVNEIIGDLDIESGKRLELNDESIRETADKMLECLGFKERLLKNKGSFIMMNSDGGTFDIREPLKQMVNNLSKENMERFVYDTELEVRDEIEIKNKVKKNSEERFSIYIGWEPYISRLVELIEDYNKRFEEKYYCLSFNINQFLDANAPSFILDYECFIKSDKIESYKKNEDVKKFFLELDATIKRLNKLSQSKSVSPEITKIANFLDLEPKKVMELIRKINFSLKFYSHWCY
jgi:transcriptional regulator with XRE-family HTH domain